MDGSRVILVGVTGGIAAYKVVDVVRRLQRSGWEAHVAMTPSAAEFVTPMTFAALTRHPVLLHMFPDATRTAGDDLYPHLFPATRADAFLVCPATAGAIARLAAGMADDVVTASALALPGGCRRFFAPAMHPNMWASAAVQDNVRRLEEAGWIRIGPGQGAMACGVEGEGRMAEPEEIEAAVGTSVDLQGRRLLILSGPTREPIDAVRFISNASSGRMGRELALEASARGANVVFVTGPVAPPSLPVHPRVRIVPVTTARQMLTEAKRHVADADAVIFAAAVADVAPVRAAAGKLPKARLGRAIALAPTPDIAAELPSRPGQLRIGFALESGCARTHAAAKLRSKRFDAIVLNGPDSPGAEAAEFEFLQAGSPPAWSRWGRVSKAECARRILNHLVRRWTSLRT